MNFATSYAAMCYELLTRPVSVKSRGMEISYEMIDATVEANLTHGVTIFSCETHRVVPIRFILAEFAWMMAGSNSLELIESYNKGMRKYSDDNMTLNGAYGYRLKGQIDCVVRKLKEDPDTRQACMVIFRSEDTCVRTKDMPCNVFLQFLIRNKVMDLIVTSRSSDFVTGLSIDMVHWQLLLMYMVNELNAKFLEILPGKVICHIGSLHVYKRDRLEVERWSCADNIYEHRLWSVTTLQELIADAKLLFRKNLTICQLADILGLSSESSRKILDQLHHLFMQHRNEVQR